MYFSVVVFVVDLCIPVYSCVFLMSSYVLCSVYLCISVCSVNLCISVCSVYVCFLCFVITVFRPVEKQKDAFDEVHPMLTSFVYFYVY